MVFLQLNQISKKNDSKIEQKEIFCWPKNPASYKTPSHFYVCVRVPLMCYHWKLIVNNCLMNGRICCSLNYCVLENKGDACTCNVNCKRINLDNTAVVC